MTEPVNTPISGELMFQIREAALRAALGIAGLTNEAGTGKVLYDAGACLHFLINGMPIDEVPGYVTAPKPNTPDVLAGAGGVETPAAPKATRGKAKLTTVPTGTAVVAATSPVQTAPAAPAAASVPVAATLSTASSPQTIAPPTTLQAAAEALKALVQNQKVGTAPTFGRAIAISLLTEFGVAQLNQIPATRLAEFKARLDAAMVPAIAALVANGSDLL